MERHGRGTMYRLWASRFLSSAGSGIAGIALTASVYERTGSAVWLSATLFLTFGISGLAAPLAGVIADKFDRRKVMIASDTLAALIWGLLLVRSEIWWLLLFAFLASIVEQPFYSASQAAVPNIVDSEDLGWANGLLSTAGNTAMIVGFALGGVITAAFGTQTAFEINTVSFMVSAAIVSTIHVRFQESDRTHERTHVMEGFRVLLREPALRALFIVWTAQYLTVDVVLVAELPLAKTFGLGAEGYGWMMTSWAVGALLGSYISMRVITRKREPWGVLGGSAGIGVGLGIIALAPSFALVLVGEVTAAFGTSVDEVAGTATVQRQTGDANRGRVFAAVHSAGLMANALGFVFAGFLVAAFGPRPMYAAAGIASLALLPLLRPLFTAAHTKAFEEDVREV